MTTLAPAVDVARLQSLVDEGYLTMRRHPEVADLLIWNYTAKTQYERHWTAETRLCRGLITTSDGTIMARPFEKFFNLEEYEDLVGGSFSKEPFTVTAKMDGSLGILYRMPDGEPRIATRGSFVSEQALRATKILKERYYSTLPWQQLTEFTLLFEIIYPENRIVVDYAQTEDLVLLAVIHTRTGMELDLSLFRDMGQAWPTPIVKHYDGIADLDQLRATQEENAEGFVIRYAGGLRLKLKFAEYVRLHKLLTSCTARTVWECLSTQTSLQPLLDRVPEEFAAWIRQTSKTLSDEYRRLHGATQRAYSAICASVQIPAPVLANATITLQELRILDRSMKRALHERFQEYPELLPFLAILANNAPAQARPKLEEAIWKRLYPAAEKPFRLEEEG